MNKDPFDYLSPYVVSIQSANENERTPAGSGTFVKFKFNNQWVYGILTATHVLEEIGILNFYRTNSQEPIRVKLSKAINRNGDPILFEWKVGVINYLCRKYYRFLKQQKKIETKGKFEHSKIDLSLLIISIGFLPENKLTQNSSFFDLEAPFLPDEHYPQNYPLVFYQGACADNEFINNELTNTGIKIVFSGKILNTTIPHLKHRMIPKKEFKESVHGASGAGAWVFYTNGSGFVNLSLRGIIIEFSNVYGMKILTAEFIYKVFLPAIKASLLNAWNEGNYYCLKTKSSSLCIKLPKKCMSDQYQMTYKVSESLLS